MKISEWQSMVYELAVVNGFHGGPLGVWQHSEVALPQVALKLALIHGEVSEALEELRDDPRKLNTYVEVPGGGLLWKEDIDDLDDDQLKKVCHAFGLPDDEKALRKRIDSAKPEGFAVELADAVIRIFDLAGALGLDLEAAMERKHEYNRGRPFMHGKQA